MNKTLGMLVVLYAYRDSAHVGTDNFLLLSGEDFLLLDATNFLLFGT